MAAPPFPRRVTIAGAALLGLGALAVLLAERRRPLRAPTTPERERTPTNLVMGAMSLAVVAALEQPLSDRAARWAERRRFGLAQRLPRHLRAPAAFLLLDYTTYLWHVATHEVPALWRLHLVHHSDVDMDAGTAMRFHALDMVVSTPVRLAQVLLSGAGPRALAAWRAWFFFAVLFHHSNLRLPRRWDRRLSAVVTTPRMHGIHHSAVRAETGSNWSSGLSLWDHLHGTFRLDVSQERIAIGVPRYRAPLGLARLLGLPFGPRPDAWSVGTPGVRADLVRVEADGA